MENLAPAGNWEALERAVAAGADAVYLGYAAFSARATAGNFDEDELRRAVAYAHLHHVRVHVTVNTLVKDSELPQVMDVLRLLNAIPVDAVLIQDMGVLSLARTCFPELPVHASTQMSIHNATGAAWCRRQGMTRAVLARECSLEEIALAAKESIEIEVFGHGAQCVGVSGQCLYSSMIGGRSGNRGRCAQPCRMLYDWRGRTAAWLSPRDVCLRDHLPALKKAGVASVKLEGRLKRPEYVSVVAGSYRGALDSLADGTFRPADETEKRALRQIFQRGGFMRGYAMGCEDAGVICEDRVNHGGVSIGVVESVGGGMARVRLTLPLNDGDGLQIRGREDGEMIYAGHDKPAGEIASLRLRPDLHVRAGDEVVRLTDARQLAQARAVLAAAIPVDMTLTAMPDQALMLTVTDGESWICAEGEPVSQARSRAMTDEDARRSLEKTGDTPFVLRELTVETAGAFVPVAALNALRRDALTRLEAERSRAFGREPGREAPAPEIVLPAGGAADMIICRDAAQLATAAETGARLVWFPEDFREEALRRDMAQLPCGAWLHLPVKCEEQTLRMLHGLVTEYADKLGGVVLGSVGQLGLTWPVPVGAGSGIPVMNRRAAQFLLDAGCTFVTASAELTGQELQTLTAGNPPVVVPAYGRTQLMLLHHCPARTALGLTQGHASCRMCDTGAPDALTGGHFTDRKGYAFPVLRQRLPEGCLVRLMNTLPTDNLARAAKYPRLVEFTDESAEQTAAVLRVYAQGGSVDGATTAGHWQRGVE